MKRFVSLCFALLFLLSCTACSYTKAYEGALKKFTVEELTVTLTDEFMKMSVFAEGYTAAFGAPDATLLILKETFEDLGIDNSYSSEDYAWAVHDGYSTDTITDVYTEDGLVYFEFSATAEEGNVYKYFAVCYKSTDAFWLLQFATDEPFYDTYRPYFVSWAKSVTFSD